MHAEDLWQVNDGKAVNEFLVFRKGVLKGGVIRPRWRVHVVLLQRVWCEEAAQDGAQAALVPGVRHPSAVCDLNRKSVQQVT